MYTNIYNNTAHRHKKGAMPGACQTNAHIQIEKDYVRKKNRVGKTIAASVCVWCTLHIKHRCKYSLTTTHNKPVWVDRWCATTASAHQQSRPMSTPGIESGRAWRLASDNTWRRLFLLGGDRHALLAAHCGGQQAGTIFINNTGCRFYYFYKHNFHKASAPNHWSQVCGQSRNCCKLWVLTNWKRSLDVCTKICVNDEKWHSVLLTDAN